ncbi:MAG: 50S ribosomal protein L29 [Candidatus Omnitrophica bacterium]|jgi:large subunit ribosomal protein L29|nr:50S ribosomal protein L29 [Candidatus Omnitrophota bacterium]
MKIKDLRGLSKDELIQKEKVLREDLFKMNSQRYSGRVDKPHMFSLIKRDIARVKTLLNEKKPASPAGVEKTNG